MLIVPVGLPGSGKTVLSRKFNTVINADELFKDNYTLDDLINYIKEYNYTVTDVYLDGLFITRNLVKKLIETFDYYIRLVYFKPNIENCIYNDLSRNREKDSVNIIYGSDLSFMKESYFRNKIRETMEVYKADYVEYIKEENNFQNYIETQEYVLEGSTYGTCWDEDGPSETTPDDPYHFTDFTELEKIFKKMNIPYTEENYNKIESVIEEEDRSEGDYYGGYAYKEVYRVEVTLLIKAILKEFFGIDKTDMAYIKKEYPELIF